MAKTVQTRHYQDPLEGEFERRIPWTFIFSSTVEDAPVRILADDLSGREIAIPVGAILEMAEVLMMAPVAPAN